ncbi:MAG: hypothetical protein ABL872_17940 [Lacibacter sp.]
MALNRPFKRTCRQFTDGSYSNSGKYQYLYHANFAKSPGQYIRAFLLIQKDLQLLFDYIEPSDINSVCYSYRIHELLLRTCVEVEANCKAILLENGYKKNSALNMEDYRKINKSHHLSSYQIGLPLWHGEKSLRTPFLSWSTGSSLNWYKAYNSTKHDRHDKFELASFDNLIEAVCGLVSILSAQFWEEDFIPSDSYLALEGSIDGMETAIGKYFRVKFPNDWANDEQYDFSHEEIKQSTFEIQCYDYNKP